MGAACAADNLEGCAEGPDEGQRPDGGPGVPGLGQGVKAKGKQKEPPLHRSQTRPISLAVRTDSDRPGDLSHAQILKRLEELDRKVSTMSHLMASAEIEVTSPYPLTPVTITVPPGMRGGDTIPVEWPVQSGLFYEILVPPGLAAGDVFTGHAPQHPRDDKKPFARTGCSADQETASTEAIDDGLGGGGPSDPAAFQRELEARRGGADVGAGSTAPNGMPPHGAASKMTPPKMTVFGDALEVLEIPPGAQISWSREEDDTEYAPNELVAHDDGTGNIVPMRVVNQHGSAVVEVQDPQGDRASKMVDVTTLGKLAAPHQDDMHSSPFSTQSRESDRPKKKKKSKEFVLARQGRSTVSRLNAALAELQTDTLEQSPPPPAPGPPAPGPAGAYGSGGVARQFTASFGPDGGYGSNDRLGGGSPPAAAAPQHFAEDGRYGAQFGSNAPGKGPSNWRSEQDSRYGGAHVAHAPTHGAHAHGVQAQGAYVQGAHAKGAHVHAAQGSHAHGAYGPQGGVPVSPDGHGQESVWRNATGYAGAGSKGPSNSVMQHADPYQRDVNAYLSAYEQHHGQGFEKSQKVSRPYGS